jgi:hypothetical protein
MCILCSQFSEQLTYLKKKNEELMALAKEQSVQLQRAMELVDGYKVELAERTEQLNKTIGLAKEAQEMAHRALDRRPVC